MFIRITVLEFDPANASEVERFWRERSRPSALSQKGNLGAKAFRVVHALGQMIMVGEWETKEEAETYLQSPEHVALNDGLAPYLKGCLVRYVGESVD
ncbi:MAG: antibiotic biosynthesis monooxygenase [Chitinivibrionales bacterium]|nr:antibiotic biosynthesis monooxygenase [Chitinivibrionales bacterium]